MPPELKDNTLEEQISDVDTSVRDDGVIDSRLLRGQQDFRVRDRVQPSGSSGLEAALADPFVEGLQQRSDTSERGTRDALEGLTSSLSSQEGFDSLLLDAEEDTGVSEAEKELLDIQDQLRREQLALRRQRERIQTEGGGLKIGAAAEIQNLERESLSKQADLAIVGLAAQARFDSAKAMADRKARVMFEQQENKIKTRKFFYQENKDLFNKNEQRLFETRLNDRERQLEQERADFESLQSVKLSALQMAQTNGAPPGVLSAIQQADSPEEVIHVGGQWGSVDMLDRMFKKAQIAKANAEYKKLTDSLSQGTNGLTPEQREKIGKFEPSQKAQAQIRVAEMMMRLKGLVQEHGATNIVDTEARGAINSLRSDLMLAISDANGQGAISDGDRGQYDALLGDGWGKSNVLSALDTSIETVNGGIESNLELVEATFPGASIGFEPFKQFNQEVALSTSVENALAAEEIGEEQTDDSAIKQFIQGFSQVPR